ncbi:unnamed protein product [Kuraishia capsulata CBS 1993]|uniref:CDC20/Fizzy WD40 domain-containing protein n=1 Tax=Kuraishia capsulata CBS 1993 TaxID=1382522 RepID=W6MG04_9ASCO|nr:uncharacterized protein KUCA_T00000871001 [Kuraishia capsulata CBS 1993]CDK24904.1 unnamed protein product [Kuraishia capsulata CBS 1993]
MIACLNQAVVCVRLCVRPPRPPHLKCCSFIVCFSNKTTTYPFSMSYLTPPSSGRRGAWHTSGTYPILDRFIPHISANSQSQTPVQHTTQDEAFNGRRHLHLGVQRNGTRGLLFYEDDPRSITAGTFNIGDLDEASQGAERSGSNHSASQTTKKVSKKAAQNDLAQALGLPSGKRVLCYSPVSLTKSKRRHNHSPISMGSIPKLSLSLNVKTNPKKKKVAKPEVSFKVLDAPGLRNDFYSNLVSWSATSNKVAVGLNCAVYVRSEIGETVPVDLNDDEVITCVSFSFHDLLAIGTKTGRIILCTPSNNKVEWSEILRPSTGVSCILWFKDSKIFIAGDELGDITFYQVETTPTGHKFSVKLSMRCHQQQICGIALSRDQKQITVGGNDNCCTVWDISDIASPQLRFYLPHKAAVKAIAYCPWSPSLIATGGGSKDRMIKFWHANSGTLLDSFNAKGQITSLVWSKSKKQILATFGFSDFEEPCLICVYSYPSMKPVVQVPASSGMRVLSAVQSPDSKSICTAINDQSVRFYDFWESSIWLTSGSQERGLFGSEIIELSEGVSKDHGVIR